MGIILVSGLDFISRHTSNVKSVPESQVHSAISVYQPIISRPRRIPTRVWGAMCRACFALPGHVGKQTSDALAAFATWHQRPGAFH